MCVWVWMCWMNECRSWFIGPREPLSACPAESWWLQPLCKTNPVFSFCCSHHTTLPRLESQTLHSSKKPSSQKMTTGFCFIKVWSKTPLHVRDSYYTVKNHLDYGGAKKSWLKTKVWFILSSLTGGGGGFSWLHWYSAGICHWSSFWQHISTFPTAEHP